MPFKGFFLKCCKPEKKNSGPATNKLAKDCIRWFKCILWPFLKAIFNCAELVAFKFSFWLTTKWNCMFHAFHGRKKLLTVNAVRNNYLNQRCSWRKIWKTSGRNSETFKIRFNSRSIIESTKLAVIKQTPSSQHVIKQHFE